MQTTNDTAPLFKTRRAAVLNAAPPAVVTFEKDFETNSAAFAGLAKANPGTAFLLQIGFEHETPGPAAHLADVVKRFLSEVPDARIVVLCNSEKECEALSPHGVETRFASHNAFLDERRYSPLPGGRGFDAAYIARLTPFKRHGLIPEDMAEKMLFLGCSVREAEREYANGIRKRYAKALWVPRFGGLEISRYLSMANCGLALSASEGACFGSSEYLLCGLPVVDTPALGGRSRMYPGDFVKYADPTQASVGEAIEYWRDNVPDPRAVREAWLAKARPMRETYRELMKELCGRDCGGKFPHKLGIRTPHPGAAFSIAAAAWLAVKRIFPRQNRYQKWKTT